jgi:hypothetical protein
MADGLICFSALHCSALLFTAVGEHRRLLKPLHSSGQVVCMYPNKPAGRPAARASATACKPAELHSIPAAAAVVSYQWSSARRTGWQSDKPARRTNEPNGDEPTRGGGSSRSSRALLYLNKHLPCRSVNRQSAPLLLSIGQRREPLRFATGSASAADDKQTQKQRTGQQQTDNKRQLAGWCRSARRACRSALSCGRAVLARWSLGAVARPADFLSGRPIHRLRRDCERLLAIPLVIVSRHRHQSECFACIGCICLSGRPASGWRRRLRADAWKHRHIQRAVSVFVLVVVVVVERARLAGRRIVESFAGLCRDSDGSQPRPTDRRPL